ncbi:MAG TPA: hypothetical protein VGA69_09635 [Nitriliruptorales bacterium]
MAFFPSGSHRWSRSESWWGRHSLSIVLLVILIVQSVAFHLTEVPDWASDQQSHGDPTALWPAYWLHYPAEWFVSVLADTYGALLLVVLTKWFYEEGSAESAGQN